MFSKPTTKDVVYSAFMAAIIAVCSQITLPIGPVPFTLQTFGVMMAIGLLGGQRATLSVLVYIILGACGLPVFAGFKSGPGVLFGLTGGYILGFLVMCLLCAAAEWILGKKPVVTAVACVLGLVLCYVFGTTWFYVVYINSKGSIELADVLSKCVTPFLLPELGKIALAVLLMFKLPDSLKEKLSA